MAPKWRQCGVECGQRLRTKRSQFAALRHEGVHGHDAGTAGVGEDGQCRAARRRLRGQDLRHVEEVGDRVDAQNAGAAEGGVEDRVGPGQRPRVRSRRLRSLLVTAGLHDDDLLCPGHAAGGAEKLAHVAD